VHRRFQPAIPGETDAALRRFHRLPAVGGEPIYLRHLDIKEWLDLSADVFKAEVFAMGQLRRYEANQAPHSTRPHREHQREDVFAEIDVQVLGKRPRDFHIRN